jgi:signal transduction histidine kinase
VRERLSGPEADRQSADLQRLMRQLTIIHDQSAKLGRLVRELLDVSRIQSGRLEFDLQPIDLADVARTVVEQTQMTAPGYAYELKAEERVPVMGDRDHLEQVVANLVDNAVKYSPEGGPVRVRVWRDGTQAHLIVEDEGIGIPPQQVDRIFELFFRTQEAEARRTPGLGLGLYITRGIVARHGGRIWAESEMGKGTRVHVTVPIGTSPSRTADIGLPLTEAKAR